MPNIKHDNAFDALRLSAALLVIFGHAFRLTGEPSPSFAGVGVATTGVKIFFVVSGYLVAKSWLRDPHPRRFLQRRLLRIMPGLVPVVLLTVFVLGPMATSHSVITYFSNPETWSYLANLAFYPADRLPGVFVFNLAPYEVNGSLWSLPAETSMYLILPIAAGASYALTYSYRLFAIATILFALVALLVFVPTPEMREWLIYGTRVWAWCSVAPFFLFGACYELCGWDRFFHRGVALLLALVLFVLRAPPVAEELLLLVALPYVTLTFGTGPAPFGGALTRRGDFSYGLYLYAFPVQQAVGASGGAFVNFAVATIVAGGCAALSWHFIEQPALRAKPTVEASSRIYAAFGLK